MNKGQIETAPKNKRDTLKPKNKKIIFRFKESKILSALSGKILFPKKHEEAKVFFQSVKE